MGWLMRPVLAGLCKYESLTDCSLDLSDFALMNDALDIQEENQRRYDAARKGDDA